MLLLLLFMGCLASCAAQTLASPSPPSPSTETSAMTTASVQTTPVLPSADPELNVMAILQAAVSSNLELNETTAAPVLNKLHEIIQGLEPNITFSLSLKSIIEV